MVGQDGEKRLSGGRRFAGYGGEKGLSGGESAAGYGDWWVKWVREKMKISFKYKMPQIEYLNTKHFRLSNLHNLMMHSQESAIQSPNTIIDATPASSGGMK
ncbi:unnamed protein product [Dovyalis caffra]|uniref:Uncharacterized protein n=1 Tax=Dovyalis caffra TaxID=77055 RepID=A0AAV1S4Q9_9ROSI|nr:unnamed protein product [Dovyalis caffra]